MLTKYGTQWYAIIGTKKKHPSMRQTCELLDAWLMGGCNLLFITWKSISFWLCRRKSQRQSTWCLTNGVRPQLRRSSWGKAATLNKRLSGRSGFCRLGDILRETLRLGSCGKPKRHRSKQIQLGSRLGVIHGVRFPKWGKIGEVRRKYGDDLVLLLPGLLFWQQPGPGNTPVFSWSKGDS